MTARLDLWSKSMPILNKIPTFKWKSNNNKWKRLQLLKFCKLSFQDREGRTCSQKSHKQNSNLRKKKKIKNDRKVRLVVKNGTILNKYLSSNGNPITMTENVYKC